MKSYVLGVARGPAGSVNTSERRQGICIRTLQSDSVLLDGADGSVRDDGLATLKDGGNIDLFPVNRDL